ncbi:MAG TPA: trigger factor [Bacteroidales bacterium]|nr:MAG: trigger factor [Bacteroidetes bacterium GWE2_42_24]OFY28900.1 MAG: trigger factor [Bacteroidetes bacterium GWF2_43_11]HBZ67736.1 trigger factor [Bacteroidales bacterium]
MNIIRENKGDLNVSLTIKIEEADYSPKVEKTLKDYRRKANVPGFRPGMVPASVIKKMYGKSIAAEEVNKLISESIEEYIKTENLKILGQPLPNYDVNQPMDFDNQTSFDFTVDMGLAPEFTVDLTGFETPHTLIIAEEEQIDAMVKNICSRHGEILDVETAEPGDRLFGKFDQLDESGNVLEGGLSSSRSFDSSEIVDEDTKALFLKVAKGARIRFSPLKAVGEESKVAPFLAMKAEDVAGVNSDFQFEVESISRNIPHEINEELYKKAFPKEEINSEADFRNIIGKAISLEMQGQADRYFYQTAVNNIIEHNKLPLPDDFLHRYAEVAIKDTDQSIKTDEDYNRFADGIRWELIENKLLTDYEIKVEQPEVRSYATHYLITNYFQFLQGIENPEENEYIQGSVDKMLKDSEQVHRIYDILIEQKLMNMFKEKLVLKENQLTFNAFIESLKPKSENE